MPDSQDNPAPDQRDVSPPAVDASIAQRQLNVLRDKLRHIDRQLAAATQNNGKLVSALEAARIGGSRRHAVQGREFAREGVGPLRDVAGAEAHDVVAGLGAAGHDAGEVLGAL